MECYSEKSIYDILKEHFNIFNSIEKTETDETISYSYTFNNDTSTLVTFFNKVTLKYEAKIYQKGKCDKVYPVSFSEICSVLEEIFL